MQGFLEIVDAIAVSIRKGGISVVNAFRPVGETVTVGVRSVIQRIVGIGPLYHLFQVRKTAAVSIRVIGIEQHAGCAYIVPVLDAVNVFP